MSCPTCGHTMHSIASSTSPVYWCPRCGTLEDHTNGLKDVSTPKLVERCRKFKGHAAEHVTQTAIDIWKRLGIEEAINLPDERPESRP